MILTLFSPILYHLLTQNNTIFIYQYDIISLYNNIGEKQMKFPQKVREANSSLVITIPSNVVTALNLKTGTWCDFEINIRTNGEKEVQQDESRIPNNGETGSNQPPRNGEHGRQPGEVLTSPTPQ